MMIHTGPQIFGLGCFTYPDFEYPPGVGGFYYDGQSVHQSAPADNLEMDSNANRLFSVFQTQIEARNKNINKIQHCQ